MNLIIFYRNWRHFIGFLFAQDFYLILVIITFFTCKTVFIYNALDYNHDLTDYDVETLLPRFFDDKFDEDSRSVFNTLWLIVIVPSLVFFSSVTSIIRLQLFPNFLSCKKQSTTRMSVLEAKASSKKENEEIDKIAKE